MSDTQSQLRDTFQKIEHSKKVARHLEAVNQQLTEAQTNLDQLSRQLEKEFKDIEKLENLSLKGLFHKVLGSKEEQIEKERQEYLQVSLKYDEAKKSADLLAYERDLLEEKVQSLPKLKAKLNSLIKKREQHLLRENSTVGRQLLELLRAMDDRTRYIAALEQVKDTGIKVQSVLEKMIYHLQRAKNWGQWDMTTRQRGASYQKHSEIDRARELSYQAQHMLGRFQRDLQQIYGQQHFSFNVQFDSFNRFTDIFFDNLISDWIVQRKIQNALNNVLNVKDQIIRINQSLDGESTKTEDQLTSLEQQRKQIIIDS